MGTQCHILDSRPELSFIDPHLGIAETTDYVRYDVIESVAFLSEFSEEES